MPEAPRILKSPDRIALWALMEPNLKLPRSSTLQIAIPMVPHKTFSIDGNYGRTYRLRCRIGSCQSDTAKQCRQERVSGFAQLPSDTDSRALERDSFPGATYVAWASTTSNHKQAASNLEQFLSSCAMVALSTNLAPSRLHASACPLDTHFLILDSS